MRYEITGVSTPWFGVQWQKTEGDKELARKVFAFFEDRRVLFGERHRGDEQHCLKSAQRIRQFLTEQIAHAKPGKELEASLRAMRAAARKFVETAGPDARNFGYHNGYAAAPFLMALGDLRTSIGYQLGLIQSQYPQEVEPELARILPPPDLPGQEDDLSWLPGFA